MIRPRAPQPRNLDESAVIEFRHSEDHERFYLVLTADGVTVRRIPFSSAEERQRAQNDMLNMLRSVGATDAPNMTQ